MTEDAAEITITYQPDEQSATIRCDYAGTERETRDDRVEALYRVVLEAATGELEDQGLEIVGGGEDPNTENAVVQTFGDELPQA